MTLETWPLNCLPQQATFVPMERGRTVRFDRGLLQTQFTPGAYWWEAALSLRLDDEKAGEQLAFLTRNNKRFFYVPAHRRVKPLAGDRTEPRDYPGQGRRDAAGNLAEDGSGFVTGGAVQVAQDVPAGSRYVALAGFEHRQTVFYPFDHFGVRAGATAPLLFAVQNSAPLVSTVDGHVTAEVWPPVPRALTAGEPVDLVRPYARMRLANPFTAPENPTVKPERVTFTIQLTEQS